jgi:hypothetical protein
LLAKVAQGALAAADQRYARRLRKLDDFVSHEWENWIDRIGHMQRRARCIGGVFLPSSVVTSAGAFRPWGLLALLPSLKLGLNVRSNLGKKRFNLLNLGVHFSEGGFWCLADPHLLSDQPL